MDAQVTGEESDGWLIFSIGSALLRRIISGVWLGLAAKLYS